MPRRIIMWFKFLSFKLLLLKEFQGFVHKSTTYKFKVNFENNFPKKRRLSSKIPLEFVLCIQSSFDCYSNFVKARLVKELSKYTWLTSKENVKQFRQFYSMLSTPNVQ